MPKTLLAVDDSATMRKVLEITFAGEDFRVVTADGASTGLARLSEEPIAAVIDASLGGDDGYALAKEVRARDARLAVVLMASRYNPYDANRGRDAGIDDYVDKPFDTQALIDKVKKALIAREAVAKAAASVVQPPPPLAVQPPAAVLNPPPRSGVASPAIVSPPTPAVTSRPIWPTQRSSTLSFEGGGPPPAPSPPVSSPVSAPTAPSAFARPVIPPIQPIAPPVAPTIQIPVAPFHVPPPVAPPPPSAQAHAATAPTSPPVAQAPTFAPPPAPPPPSAHAAAPPAPPVTPPAPPVAAQPPASHSVASPVSSHAAPSAPRSAEPVAAVLAATNGSIAGKLEGLGLTRQQIEAVVALSREVVERVVWEVVPQLAEALIKEEIVRLTKEG